MEGPPIITRSEVSWVVVFIVGGIAFLVEGRVVKSGGTELVDQLEAQGYDPIIREVELSAV